MQVFILFFKTATSSVVVKGIFIGFITEKYKVFRLKPAILIKNSFLKFEEKSIKATLKLCKLSLLSNLFLTKI